MGELACSSFCSMIREYAYSLGSAGSFCSANWLIPTTKSTTGIWARILAPRGARQSFLESIRCSTSDSPREFTDRFRNYARRFAAMPTREPLFSRLESQRNRALNRARVGPIPRDVCRQPRRLLAGRPVGIRRNDDQIIGAIGFLLCSIGTPCIYYGTEQGFSGHGGDKSVARSNVRPKQFGKESAEHQLPNLSRDCKNCGGRAAIGRAAVRSFVLSPDLGRRRQFRLTVRIYLHTRVLAVAVWA